jgi:hypothetical protein
MTITLQITKKIKLHLTLTYWNLLPTHDAPSFNSLVSSHYYSWGCLRLEVDKNPKTVTGKDWSDDEIVRQMKNLEKEVEATKGSSPKVKYPNKPAAKFPRERK